VLQEPGNLVLPPTHLQYKCKRDAGWGASIIVHEHYCNRVVFNTCGKNWVLIGLNFDDLGWPGIRILSAHLPLQKRKQMPGFRLLTVWMRMLSCQTPSYKSSLSLVCARHLPVHPAFPYIPPAQSPNRILH
jgi:hypothetical protein